MTEAAATPRDFSKRVEAIDRETQGDATATKYAPRDKYARQGQAETSENYVPRRMSSPDAEDTNLGSAGYRKGGYTKAADGCAKRGKTRGKMV